MVALWKADVIHSKGYVACKRDFKERGNCTQKGDSTGSSFPPPPRSGPRRVPQCRGVPAVTPGPAVAPHPTATPPHHSPNRFLPSLSQHCGNGAPGAPNAPEEEGAAAVLWHTEPTAHAGAQHPHSPTAASSDRTSLEPHRGDGKMKVSPHGSAHSSQRTVLWAVKENGTHLGQAAAGCI